MASSKLPRLNAWAPCLNAVSAGAFSAAETAPTKASVSATTRQTVLKVGRLWRGGCPCQDRSAVERRSQDEGGARAALDERPDLRLQARSSERRAGLDRHLAFVAGLEAELEHRRRHHVE